MAWIDRSSDTGSATASRLSGTSSSAPGPADESQRHGGRYLSACERSKAEAHQRALQWPARGLPLVIAMPSAEVGANDHSLFGYFLRLHLLGRLPPMAWGRTMVCAMVDVQALAEGIALAAERAPVGEDCLFCGLPQTIGAMFGHWGRHTAGAWHRGCGCRAG
ncbi:hypothetical protein [uncultured Piscinibacter sp.]|uniref:hypothetical protein n=1 Tax=uncultured Piscinibacter sp. TaxID=1131835 RepID=UPI002639DF88|nr:hypothetical protein [uncultured Piscinibacter sp.]